MTPKDYDKLYKKIEECIRKCHNLDKPPSYTYENDLKVAYRCKQWFLFACLLDEHRTAYKTPWEPLIGRRCLNHLLLMRTGLSINEIRQITLCDALLLLHTELLEIEEETNSKIPCYYNLEKLYDLVKGQIARLDEETVPECFQLDGILDGEFPIDEFHRYANWTRYEQLTQKGI
ncbi:ECs1072 family phage-associated protein [Limnobaculum xujianqingii]|uniref:ECs1072 family phage-associated protein n=1 Tax=Limnobaculum xujianqingii TaxID=2738837 RepID=UPI0011260476|nr:hypothetical protein [Limnobaculum xujianqingii]